MKVSVVTPNYNGLKFLKAYFDSLALQAEFIEEIVIVDNGSEDGSVEFIEDLIEDYPINIKLIRNSENLGFAPAVKQRKPRIRTCCQSRNQSFQIRVHLLIEQ